MKLYFAFVVDKKYNLIENKLSIFNNNFRM